MKKTIAVIGLGLMGGSMALALKGFEGHKIIGVDHDPETLEFARAHGIGDMQTDQALIAIKEADITILCLHPAAIARFLLGHRNDFKQGALVTDVCGVKSAIIEAAQALPDTVDFIGGHPMAGREKGGVKNADKGLFLGAHYLLTPQQGNRPEHIALLGRMAMHIGCRDVVETTAQAHDELIAYTSQVMHIMAVAVCDDPDLFRCRGFEGNSFRDCTRVAALDVPLWTELFSMNAPALCTMIFRLEENLRLYREALEAGNDQLLREKLEYSSARKRQMNLE